MKKIDHLALSRHLIATADSKELTLFSSAFMIGSIEPDLNPFTYLRGIRSGRRFHGHNAENASKHIRKTVFNISQRGLFDAWDYFTLGTLLHYVADSFTAVHNSFMDVDIQAHLDYENELHAVLGGKLAAEDSGVGLVSAYSMNSYLAEAHEEYLASWNSIEDDATYIIRTCKIMLSLALRHAIPQGLVRTPANLGLGLV